MNHFSKIGFILSIVGAAIGLGNAWKFPYMVGANGGSAFVLVYLVFAIVVGLSIFYAEMAMGKLTAKNPAHAFYELAPNHKKAWKFSGIMMITGVFVASFYTLIIGWVIHYTFISFSELPSNLASSGKYFENFTSKEALKQIFYFSLAFFTYFLVLAKGVKLGIERINLILIPTLFLMLFLMLGYSMSLEGFNKALEFLLVPDLSKLNYESVLNALGLAFFTMCVGIGAIMTYSASLGNDTNLFTSSLYVVALNITISIVIGLIIFTFVFEFGEKPSQGVGLAFISLPTLFAKLGILGQSLSFIFFLALSFAGLTSAVSMVEPFIFFIQQEFKTSRIKAICVVGSVVYVLGFLCTLSNISEFKDALTFLNKGFFDWLDFLSSNIMLPLGGIVICVFVGYFMKVEILKKVFLPYMGEIVFKIWYFLLKFVAPIFVIVVLIRGLI
ncbi:MAG: sodium-dependent transporter [Campylobacter sp.]|nr:sodium-dependent transporter [Campylobacter sp.]